jgi:hypothetical protein
MLYETAFLIPGMELSPATKPSIYKVLTSVEGLKGLKYYSGFRGYDTVLFDEAFKVSGAGSTARMAKDDSDLLPLSSTFTAYVHDVNMGQCWYRIDVDSAGSGFLISVANARALNVFVFSVFKPEAFRLRFALVGAEEGIYVYCLCSAQVPPKLATMLDTGEVVRSRLDALRAWSVSQIGSTRTASHK